MPLVRRSFAPGSEWLYAKLYAGSATSDQILTETIAPLVTGGAPWFFLRYSDPHWHVRFRVHGEPAWLYGELMPRLAEATRAMLDDGRMWRLQLDTYEREVERYGGPVGIDLAERLFCADSACVVDILGMLDGDAGNDARWRLALRGIDQLLDDLGLALVDKDRVAAAARDDLQRRLRADVTVLRAIGERFRGERATLERLLDRAGDAGHPLAPALAVFARRSAALGPIVDELRHRERAGRLTRSIAEQARSHVHLSVNRVARAHAVEQELVLYSFLARLYRTRLARRDPLR